MSDEINRTHRPAASSWVASANLPGTDFPIQNLPFGIFRRAGAGEAARAGVAIGEVVLDVAACEGRGLFDGPAAVAASACRGPVLNPLMALGPTHWSALRTRLFELLSAGHPNEAAHREQVGPCLVARAGLELRVPADIGDYTDFYASVFHATNVGRMMRPDSPLLPNYRHVPIGYHGRASSVVASGTVVRRPLGQTRPDGSDAPLFGPSRRLDYELEVGAFIGPGNALGEFIPHEAAERHVFGLCLVNDWSARDLQQWEYQPLGPFLGKNFATTVSPWVVTLEALAPFRVPPFERAPSDPQPLPYLDGRDYRARGGVDVHLEVWILTEQMRAQGLEAHRLSRSNLRDLYWTVSQLLTHHTSNGCNLRPGDLLASGTVSGPDRDARGCLLELAWRGSEPVQLPSGEIRRFLEDGDEIVLKGYCERSGFARIGFGECRGRIAPAPVWPSGRDASPAPPVHGVE